MSYHTLLQGKRKEPDLKRQDGSPGGSEPEPVAHLVHDTLRGWVLSTGFPCGGAQSAFNTNSYRLGIYDRFATTATPLLAADLRSYIAEYSATPALRPRGAEGATIVLNRTFASFLACFTEAPVCDESTFEGQLWGILEDLRKVDADPIPPGFSTNPADNTFAFCFGGEAFFVAAFHPGSWRWSRRFMFPLLVFNMHKQFDGLKSTGKFARLRDTIRRRDDALQGTHNEVAADFGSQSEAPQYVMRRVPPGWKPPGYSGE